MRGAAAVGLQSLVKEGRVKAVWAPAPPRLRKEPGVIALSHRMAERGGGYAGRESRGAERVVEMP